MTKLAQRQSLVSIEGIPGLWAMKQGGNVASETSSVYDGGQLRPEILTAPSLAENVTVSRPVDDVRDLPEMRRLKGLVGRFTGTITVQHTDADLFPIGDPEVYPDAILVNYNEPDADASSGEAKRLELVFAISDFV